MASGRTGARGEWHLLNVVIPAPACAATGSGRDPVCTEVPEPLDSGSRLRLARNDGVKFQRLEAGCQDLVTSTWILEPVSESAMMWDNRELNVRKNRAD